MKKSILLIAFLAGILTACQDDTLQNDNSAIVGDEICFAANHAEFKFNETRTVYGDRNGDVYPIYWENGDQIAIYCPQASAPLPNREVDYQVLVENETSSKGTLAKVNMGENGLQWGETDMHHFFSIYPVSAISGVKDANTIRCNIPVTQTPIKIEKSINFESDKTYIAYPNMNYAYMYAHNAVSRKMAGDNPISLDFKPMVTTLEITVNGPKTGSYQVSQIMIRSSQNISGDFDLKISQDVTSDKFNDGINDGVVEAVDDGTVNTLVTIPTYMVDQNGNNAPVTLSAGEKLVVKAFLLPYSDVNVNQTAVTVNMVGQGSKTKILETANIEARKINITSLPALEGTNFYYWLSAMDERTYFSQLSIPGSHNSYSVDPNVVGSNTVMTAYQKYGVEEQFQKGARAFSLMVGYNNTDYSWYNNNELYVWNGSSQGATLSSALDEYVRMLDDAITNYKNPIGRTCQEFIVLNINYRQYVGSGTNYASKFNEVQHWIKDLNYILTNYSPTTTNGIILSNSVNGQSTIADLKGKIVVFVNYQAPTLPTINDNGSYTYDPSTDATKYIFMRQVFNANDNEEYTYKVPDSYWTDMDSENVGFYGLNDRDYTFPYYNIAEGSGVSDIKVYRQNLERLNNPRLVFGNWTDNERVDNKINMIKNFFTEAIQNNTQEGNIGLNNWYFNNLGGFCVVNEDQSYNQKLGQSGNTVEEANVINGPIYNYLSDESTNSGPLGVVFMNFFGCDYITNEGESTNVYGIWLPQVIIENNFRFDLKYKQGSTQNSDARFMVGGDIVN